MATISFIDSPKTRQFTSVTYDTSDGTYQASVTFNDDETGGSDIEYYNGTVTSPSGFSYHFNVTTNTVVIPGLQCSTSYNINVTAVNCAGASTVIATCFTTPQPGECRCVCLLFNYYCVLLFCTVNTKTLYILLFACI